MPETLSTSSLADRISALIGPTITDLGFALVRVLVHGRQSARLQVMVERSDEKPMRVEDCAEISRAVSAVLDVADPIRGSYTLEVSSPGIDRPLVRIGDFERFAGFEARVELGRPIEGRKRLQGRLLGTSGEQVRIEVAGADWTVPFADVVRAKLVLTDELLRAEEQRAR